MESTSDEVNVTSTQANLSVWRSIDQLITLECRAWNSGLLAPLYDAARAVVGGPLCQAAAQRLADAIKPGDAVVVTTGAGGPPWLFNGETDGPLGAAGLARALALGCGAWPLVITEERSKYPVQMTLAAAGVSVQPENIARVRPTTATMVEFPVDPAEAERAASAFLDRYRPSAMVVVEKTSPNRVGVIHSVGGQAWTPRVEFARVEYLVAECRRRGIVTVGIGDHGNEIGFGLIEDVVRKTVPHADMCRCVCGNGMAAAVVTDVLIPASISNWGAYGVEAALAVLKGDRNLMHNATVERAMLNACVMAGGVDGITSRQIPAVDGTSGECQVAIITLLAELVEQALSSRAVNY